MKIFFSFIILLAILSSGCSSTKQSSLNSKGTKTNNDKIAIAESQSKILPTQQWADSVLHQMSLREKVAQLFIIWTKAGFLSNDGKQLQENIRFAKEVGVGGFYFSTGNAYGFPVNANKLQHISKIPLLMTADFEWGAGMRIQEAT